MVLLLIFSYPSLLIPPSQNVDFAAKITVQFEGLRREWEYFYLFPVSKCNVVLGLSKVLKPPIGNLPFIKSDRFL